MRGKIGRAWAALAVGLTVTLVAPGGLRADEPRDPAKDAAAKELFLRGLALLRADDPEHALDYFVKSRRLVATVTNTTDVAICLERLRRYDEALEMYQELITRFQTELDASALATVTATMVLLRKKVGSVDVSANVDGNVTIDGRPRGKIPFGAPLHVLPGRHDIRIEKVGFRSFATSEQVAAGGRIAVDAWLDAVAGAGVLRVEDPAFEGGVVFIDGERVGVLPWEGVLPVGHHVGWTRSGEVGSAPFEIVIVPGQTSLARPPSRELGGVIRLKTKPATAELAVDGVVVARGQWEGRLPKGDHQVSASESGYTTQSARISSTGGEAQQWIVLDRDPRDARWSAPAGHLVLGAFGALATTSTLNAYANSHDGDYDGVMGGARLGYRGRVGLGPEISAGFAEVRSRSLRLLTDHFTPPGDARRVHVHEAVRDHDWLRGPFATLGVAFSQPLWRVRIVSRAAVGIGLLRGSDAVDVSASADAAPQHVAMYVVNPDYVAYSVDPFGYIELGGSVPVGPVELGAGFGVAMFLSGGPSLAHHYMQVLPNHCHEEHERSITCAPASHSLADDRSHGPFALALPQLSASLPF